MAHVRDISLFYTGSPECTNAQMDETLVQLSPHEGLSAQATAVRRRSKRLHQLRDFCSEIVCFLLDAFAETKTNERHKLHVTAKFRTERGSCLLDGAH